MDLLIDSVLGRYDYRPEVIVQIVQVLSRSSPFRCEHGVLKKAISDGREIRNSEKERVEKEDTS